MGDVGVNVPVPAETHRRAKRAAGFLRLTMKDFVILALAEKAERHAKDIEADPDPYRRRI